MFSHPLTHILHDTLGDDLFAARNDPKGVDDGCKRLLKENACVYFK